MRRRDGLVRRRRGRVVLLWRGRVRVFFSLSRTMKHEIVPLRRSASEGETHQRRGNSTRTDDPASEELPVGQSGDVAPRAGTGRSCRSVRRRGGERDGLGVRHRPSLGGRRRRRRVVALRRSRVRILFSLCWAVRMSATARWPNMAGSAPASPLRPQTQRLLRREVPCP